MKVLQICLPHLSDVVTLPGKSKKCQNVSSNGTATGTVHV